MRTFIHDIWGCARGPATALAPQTRIIAGAALFAACMIAPATTAPGIAFGVAAAVLWLAACGLPGKLVRSSLVFGLVLFLPFFLLALIGNATPHELPGGWKQSLIVPSSILVRGLTGMFVSIATAASLNASDLREGLIRLPLPRIVSEILLQIVHQTATLVYETRRVAAAMAVRGASGGGLTAWRVLASLPCVWLPRVMQRAERVAAAMELRGYCDGELHSFRAAPMRILDGAALILVFCTLGIAVAIRWWSVI